MYAIVDVIVGVPMDKEVSDAFSKLDIEPDTRGFEMLYSGGSDICPGFCGVRLDGFDEASYFVDLSKLNMIPTPTQLAKAEAAFKGLPIEVQRVAQKVGVYFVWHTS